MLKFRWTNRREFIKRAATHAYIGFRDIAQWLDELKCEYPDEYKDVTPAANLDDPFINLLEKYAINLDEMPTRAIGMAKKAILVEFYEIARMYKNQQALEWVKKEMGN